MNVRQIRTQPRPGSQISSQVSSWVERQEQQQMQGHCSWKLDRKSVEKLVWKDKKYLVSEMQNSI